MTAKIIDGKAIAQKISEHIKLCVEDLKTRSSNEPSFAVILIGKDPASQTYVNNKLKKAKELGIDANLYTFPESVKEEEILFLIDTLNKEETINGIIVQLPLPKQIDTFKILNAIAPEKDIDGFHPFNVGVLWTGLGKGLYPSTAMGVVKLIKKVLGNNLKGKNVVMVGCSNIVGKPTSALLLKEKCTIIIAHSETENLKDICKKADILITATGRPEMIKFDWVKEDATIIDIGITRVGTTDDGKSIFKGDVDFNNVKDKVAYITPVPGGVGPMTVIMLMENTLRAFCRQNNLEDFEEKELS